MHNVRSNHVAAPSLVGRDDPIAPFAADESGRAACPHAAAPWPKVRLGEIADFIQTGPFGSQLHQHDYSEIGTPVVMPKDLICGYISETTIARVSEDHVGRLSRHKVKPGDFLFSRRGDVGRCALVREKESGWLCGTGCLRVGIKHELADSQFLLYNFSQHDIVSWLEGHAVGATMPNINPAILSDLPFSLPPLPIQRRIASVLGAYDDLIENNRRRIALLEKMARELYRERFVRRRCEFVETRADDLFNITIGKTPPRKEIVHFQGDLPWVSIADMGKSGTYVFDTSECLNRESAARLNVKKVPAGTILLSFKLTVGRVSIVAMECCTNEAIAHFVVSDSLRPYLYLYLKDFSYQSLGNTCAISDGINSKIIKAMPIKIPNDTMIEEFNKSAQPMFAEIFNLALQTRNLSRQRDRLLPRLMSGKIDLKELEKNSA